LSRDDRTRAFAPAKLNLYLHVVGRRPDGYHLLDSLIAFADIGDEVIASPASGLELFATGPFAADLPQDASANLVHRAALLLAARLGRAPEAALTLVKTLPVASGIGGGSSDAAAALRALAALWRADGDAALDEVAVLLGADVPVCIERRTAFIGGVGERVEPAPHLPPVAIVLANPGVPLATAEVFRRHAGPFSTPARIARAPSDAAALAALLAERRNDLAEAAEALVPEIADAMAALAATPGALLARMSGSGPTCFALYAEAHDADAAARSLAQTYPRWWVKAGKLI
jgi:4-diphosphocytidyl-2-C-methyl-D-erythritol kinase